MTKSRQITRTSNTLTIANTINVGNSTFNTSINSTSVSIRTPTNTSIINSSSIIVKTIRANSSLGSSNNAIFSNGSGVYWAAGPAGNTVIKNIIFANSSGNISTLTPDSNGNINITAGGIYTLVTNTSTSTINVYNNGLTSTPQTTLLLLSNTNSTVTSTSLTGSNTLQFQSGNNIKFANVANRLVIYSGSDIGFTAPLSNRNLVYYSYVSYSPSFAYYVIRGWVYNNTNYANFAGSFSSATMYILFKDIWTSSFFSSSANSTAAAGSWTLYSNSAASIPFPQGIMAIEYFTGTYDYAGDPNIIPASISVSGNGNYFYASYLATLSTSYYGATNTGNVGFITSFGYNVNSAVQLSYGANGTQYYLFANVP